MSLRPRGAPFNPNFDTESHQTSFSRPVSYDIESALIPPPADVSDLPYASRPYASRAIGIEPLSDGELSNKEGLLGGRKSGRASAGKRKSKRPIPWYRRWWVFVVIAGVILVGVGAGVGASMGTKNNKHTTAVSPDSSSTTNLPGASISTSGADIGVDSTSVSPVSAQPVAFSSSQSSPTSLSDSPSANSETSLTSTTRQHNNILSSSPWSSSSSPGSLGADALPTSVLPGAPSADSDEATDLFGNATSGDAADAGTSTYNNGQYTPSAYSG